MNITKQLLSENNKAMKFLHDVCGFDFQKDFFIYRGEGRFTYNGVDKIVSKNISGFYVLALLVMPTNAYCFEKFHYISMEKGKFDPTRHDNLKYWDCDIDYFFTIGSFEEVRKSKTSHYYIVAQKAEYIQPKKPEVNIELSQRFKYIPNPYEKAGDGKGKTWISNINLMLLDGSAKRFEYKPYETRYGYDEFAENVNEIIDKSGYLIIERHRELKHMAHTLRADRAKAAAMLADYTERETAIYKSIEDTKQRLAKQIVEAVSFKEMDAIKKSVDTLRWIIYDMELHAECKEKKYYKSISDIESRLNHVESKLKEI